MNDSIMTEYLIIVRYRSANNGLFSYVDDNTEHKLRNGNERIKGKWFCSSAIA